MLELAVIISSTVLAQDPSSLSQMHDVVSPPAVGWWPPAPGWYGLAVLTFIAAVWRLLHWVKRYRANAYRRQAVAAISALDVATQGACAEDASELKRLLKRTALTSFGRESVASLTGSAWWQWLDRTGGDGFAQELGPACDQCAHAGVPMPLDRWQALLDRSRRWVIQHQCREGGQ